MLNGLIWFTSATAGRRPRLAPLRAGAGAGRMEHGEWQALLTRFVQHGRVDYRNMVRVRRLVEVYLSRLAHEHPDAFADADDQLALYLNAFNAIAIHQVLLHYPLRSLHDVRGALRRVYPIGRRNVSLLTLHATTLRAYGDPRVHAAINLAALGSAPLQPVAFTGQGLQTQLDTAMYDLLSHTRYDAATNTLYLPALLRWFGGDFVQPIAMPGPRGLVSGQLRPAAILAAIRRYLPPGIASSLPNAPRLRFEPFDWQLNEQTPVASGRRIIAH